MSKDFGSNGFRIGVLVTPHNRTLVSTFASVVGMTMKIGSPSDALWSALLNSGEPLVTYLELNRARLAEAYEFITGWLKERGIPYRPSYAGHFVVIDLRGFMEKRGEAVQLEEEVDLLGRLVDAGVYLGPGETFFCLSLLGIWLKNSCEVGHSYGIPEFGWFRLTFSLPRPALINGLERIEKVLGIHP